MDFIKYEKTKNGIVELVFMRDNGDMHRRHIVPGQDYSTEPDEVQAVCKKIHTKSVVDKYKKQQSEETDAQ